MEQCLLVNNFAQLSLFNHTYSSLGSWTLIIWFLLTTAPGGYPQNFNAVSSTSRSADITWEPPSEEDRNGIIINYTINVTAASTGQTFQLRSTTTSITVTSLKPYTTYFCIIAASTSVGVGPPSTVFTLNTPEDGEFFLPIL